MLINLSKQYVTTLNYYVDFEALPQNKIFNKSPIKELEIKVKGTGFKILSANFSNRRIKLLANKLKTLSDSISYILPNNQKKSIQKQIYSGLNFQEVVQDTVKLNLSTLATKKVAVLANNQISFEVGYNLSKPIQFTPDSITISGSKAVLNNLNFIKTEQISFENLSESKEFDVKLENPTLNSEVKLSDYKVNVNVQVDKFTEGEFLVPFIIENLPKKLSINTYPKKVKVIYKVGLNDFNKITPESFVVSCDYKTSAENDLMYLIPKINSKSSLVQSVRLVPNKIDFLIQK